MKNLLFLIPLFIANFAIAQIPTNGLVGYWPFDGNAEDIKNNNDGVVNGAVLSTDRFSNEDGSYYFDGVDDYIEVETDELLQFGESSFSVSLWFYPENCTNARIINTRGTGPGGSYKGYHIKINEDAGNWKFYDAGIDDATNNYKYCNSCGALYPFNDWYYLTFVYEADNEIRIYINGELDGTVSVGSYGDISNTLPTVFGASVAASGIINKPSSLSQFYKGKLDDIMIFDRVLSSSEITGIFNTQGSQSYANIWQQGENNIFYEGKVSVGTSSVPENFDFAVDGKIITKEINVTLDGWADFVFNNNYILKDLEEVESFINKYNRLPEIPSEDEVIQNGINLGEMNAKLLQKIEELTLYTIEQQKKIDMLIEENKKQNKQIEELKRE